MGDEGKGFGRGLGWQDGYMRERYISFVSLGESNQPGLGIQHSRRSLSGEIEQHCQYNVKNSRT